MILETARLTLREMNADDLDFLAEMLGDAEVMRFYPQVLDRAGAQTWLDRTLARYAKDGRGFWLVSEKKSGAPVGQVGLMEQEWDGTRDTEIGYMIHRPFWRRGFAAEAAAACRDHAFHELKRARVISLVRDVNLPSAAVARSMGMQSIAQTTRAGFAHDVFAVRNS